MLGKAVLCLMTLRFCSISGQEQCTDMRGRQVSHGLHYVPGPDTCTLCVCDNGLPKVCKAVLCSPPQDCRSFRVGNTCCEFICLDDVVKPAESAEANVRMAAGGAAAVVLVTVALVVYRVRKQKRRRPPHADDQRSLTSIGYISGSMGYMGGTCETALGAWKPPSNYLPRGEAPPPYEEAIGQCRPETIRLNEYHRSYANVVEVPRPEEPCPPHPYANVPRQQIANPQSCYNAPLLQTVHAAETREPSAPHLSLAPTMSCGSSGGSATARSGSLGTISARHVPLYTTQNMHTALHRTIPRISTALDTTLLDTPIGFSRADRSLHNEIRRSFHKPSDNRLHTDTGRSMRNLNLLANDVTNTIDLLDDTGRTRLVGGTRAHSEECDVNTQTHHVAHLPHVPPATHVPHLPHPQPHQQQHQQHLQHVPHSQHVQHSQHLQQQNAQHSQQQNVHIQQQNVQHAQQQNVHILQQNVQHSQQQNVQHLPPPQHLQTQHTPAPTLPLTVDKPSCVCSYAGNNAPLTEDGDDYRSECENCKSASSSRWVLEEGWEEESRDGTQTLQRHAPAAAPPPPATATLPQPVTKQTRTVIGPPSNWENWFNTIPDSDSESEEE